MASFNPAVQDRSAEFIFQGLNQAGAIAMDEKARERKQLGAIFGGMADMGAKAGGVFMEQTAKQRSNLGKMETIGSMGLLPADKLDELAKIKDPDKLAGALAVVDDMVKMNERRSMMVDEFGMRRDLAREQMLFNAGLQKAEAASDRTGQTTTMIDPVTGQKVGGYFQNNRQVVPFKQVTGGGAPTVQKVDLGGGAFAYFDSKGKALPKSAVQGGAPTDPAAVAKLTALQSEVAMLEGEVAKRGEQAVDGLNWWPGSETLGTRLKGAKAQLESLMGGGGGETTTAAPTYATPQDVKAAYRAGKLTQEQAAQILSSQFNMQ